MRFIQLVDHPKHYSISSVPENIVINNLNDVIHIIQVKICVPLLMYARTNFHFIVSKACMTTWLIFTGLVTYIYIYVLRAGTDKFLLIYCICGSYPDIRSGILPVVSTTV